MQQQRAKRYVEENGLESVITGMMNEILIAQPEKPKVEIFRFLYAKLSAEEKEAVNESLLQPFASQKLSAMRPPSQKMAPAEPIAAAEEQLGVQAVAQLAEALQTEEGEVALKEFFMSLDKDGDGKVSKKEWGSKVGKQKELMSKYFGGATAAEVGAAFNRIDTNRDGSLSWEEFLAATKAMQTVALRSPRDDGEELAEFLDPRDSLSFVEAPPQG